MPENSPHIKIHYQKPVFIKERSNGQEARKLTDAMKRFSGFVFLISMKYLKNEEKAKQASISVLKKFFNKPEPYTSEQELKIKLYLSTKAYFEENTD